MPNLCVARWHSDPPQSVTPAPASITSPPLSVSRSSRPLWRKVSRLWSKPEQVQDRRVDVVDVGLVLGGAQADRVGRADRLPALHAAAGQPHARSRAGCGRGRSCPRSSACGRTRRPRSPACPSSRPRRFRSVSSPAIGLSLCEAELAVVALEVGVGVPAVGVAAVDLHEAHAALDHPPGQQAAQCRTRPSPCGRGRRASSSPRSPSPGRRPPGRGPACGRPVRRRRCGRPVPSRRRARRRCSRLSSAMKSSVRRCCSSRDARRRLQVQDRRRARRGRPCPGTRPAGSRCPTPGRRPSASRRGRAARRTPACSGSRCPGRRSTHAPRLGRPIRIEPVFIR